MKQGLLAFQYEEEKSTTGMTALSGLMTYVELMHVAGLRSSVERRVGLRGGGQGWTDSQIITSLILLNLAGGESVMDLEVLEKDAGLCRVLRHAETHGMRRRERRALKARWRGERWRSVPSDSVVFRYLERFHDAGEEAKREAHRAFIPSPNDALKGLGKVNAGLVDFVQSRSPHTQATLDMGRLPGGEPQEGGAVQLQEVQGVSAAHDLLSKGRPGGALGVSRRQRACGPSAASSVEGGSGTSACWGGQGHAEV